MINCPSRSASHFLKIDRFLGILIVASNLGCISSVLRVNYCIRPGSMIRYRVALQILNSCHAYFIGKRKLGAARYRTATDFDFARSI